MPSEPQIVLPVGRNATAEVWFRGPERPTREHVEMLIRFLRLMTDAFPVGSPAEGETEDA